MPLPPSATTPHLPSPKRWESPLSETRCAKGPKAANRLAELPGSLLKAEGLTADEAEHLRRSLDLWRIAVRKVDFPSALGWVGVVSWLTEEVALMQ
ncbi:MAG: hypothetical protein ACYS91_16140, partial [Planctomycetota bacterium]